MIRVTCCAVAFCFLTAGLARASAIQPDEPKKPEPKREEKKEPKKPLPFPFPFPDLDKMIPPGLDPAKAKEMRAKLQKHRDEMMKIFEEAMKKAPGPKFPPNFPGFPPGFPGGAFPGQFPGGMFASFAMPDARLGVRLQPPSPALADQLDLPEKQGMVLQEVKKDSAAAKAGLKVHDILLELAGKAVPSRPDLYFKMVHDIKADQKIDAVVIRKGKKTTIKDLVLPEAKGFPGFPGFQPPGGFPPPRPPARPGGLRPQTRIQPLEFQWCMRMI